MTGNRWIRVTLYGLLMALACFALTYGLGDRLMWGDEAETALLAVNITKYGLPKVADGKNRITIYGTEDANEQGIWVWSPWLDEYVAAASFMLFGKSTVAARMPFALIGLVSVALLGLVARRIYGSHRVAMGAMLLYVTCIPFLLHARQCRYYAILMLAQIWLIWSYQRILEGGRVPGGIQAALALAVQFYCNYMVIPGNLLGLGLASLLLRRRYPGLILTMAAAVGGSGLLAAPWLLYASTGRQLQGLDWLGAAGKAAFHIANINAHIFPLLLLIPLVMIRRRHAMTTLLWLLPVAQLLCLSLLPFRYFRYITPMIPVILLLGAAILMTRLKPLWLGTLLLAIAAFTNLFSVAGSALFGDLRAPGLPFATYVRSVASEYTDRLEASVQYLSREGSPEQTIFVPDPEFPLIFYTDMRLLDARYRKLNEQPDWIIPASPSGLVDQTLPIPPFIDALYERVTITVPASPRNGSRPDPEHFAFFTTTKHEQLVLYKRRPRRVELQP
jgi:hypothetical protein